VFGLARRALLAASTNAWLRDRAMKTAFIRRSVSAFMPGETLEDAMRAASAESARGISSLLTKLGENLEGADHAEAVTSHYLDALDAIAAAGLNAQISVKPSQLGLDIGLELCFANLQRLVDRADRLGNFVWIDMESSPFVDRTLDLFRRSRARSPRVGVALQAYLRRTQADLESLIPLGPSVRIVKGAYLERSSIAFPRKAEVDESFYTLVTRMLRDEAVARRSMVQIATHDERLVQRVQDVIDERRPPASAYEFAMLFGIGRPLQTRIAASGRPLRVLISYGDYWFPWYMRRLAERPANLWFVARNLVAR
jgi:proline dehydrogenase